MRKLTIGTPSGSTRDLVLWAFVNVEHAEGWLERESGALPLLPGTGVPAPGLLVVVRPPRIAKSRLIFTNTSGMVPIGVARVGR
ncbi:hypothetical protein GCM10010234_17760 [Streptomyces hawaiiensis]|uniref:hypothetical protein n=1 Tax=Streptomyces hawaiiensis TaxID=67305 RepID=UPI0031DD4993